LSDVLSILNTRIISSICLRYSASVKFNDYVNGNTNPLLRIVNDLLSLRIVIEYDYGYYLCVIFF